MEPTEKAPLPSGWLDRFRRSWFPPAAVVGAFAAFAAAAVRSRPSAPALPPAPPRPAPVPSRTDTPPAPAPSARRLEREYIRSGILGGQSRPFRRPLAGLAVGFSDRIWALSDDEIEAFEPDGAFIGGWKLPRRATCLAVGPDRRVYIGSKGQVDIYDENGRPSGGFAAGDGAKPAFITCVKVIQGEILVGDAGARRIRRYTSDGRQVGEIGARARTGGFMLPNGALDFAVGGNGVVYAADSGRHRVTSWALDGSPLGQFGRFGQQNLEDFSGCCNPVNLAVTPDGNIVTGEKAAARVKVYEPGGALLGAIDPAHFDARCTHLYLSVDSTGRILVADPVAREVKIFSRAPAAA